MSKKIMFDDGVTAVVYPERVLQDARPPLKFLIDLTMAWKVMHVKETREILLFTGACHG